MSRLTRSAMLTSCLALSSPLTHADLPIAPFQAHYDLYGSGLPVGEALMALEAAGSNGYAMRFEVRPNQWVALLASNRIQEHANGEIRDGQVRPLRFERQADTGRETQHVQLRFDWPAAQIEVHSHAGQATLPLSPGVTDPLSLNLAVMWDLQRGQLPEQYALVDGIEPRVYQIRNEGEDTLKTAFGPVRTVRVSQTRPDGNRTTTFWFAIEWHFLPVQITRQKKGREDLRLEIRSLERRAP
jgi:hypothetical protein